jgi:hypothetical protein
LDPDSSPAFSCTDRIGSGRGVLSKWRRSSFSETVEEYHDEQIPGVIAKLVQRIQAEPFNLVGTLIFLGAIIHTFLASRFMLILLGSTTEISIKQVISSTARTIKVASCFV